MTEKYVTMFRRTRISANLLKKYPKNTIWVDIWHLMDDNPEVFSVYLHQSEKHFKNYWNGRAKTLGYGEQRSLNALTTFCRELMKMLDLPTDAFQFHGSTLGDSGWLQNQIKKKEIAK